MKARLIIAAASIIFIFISCNYSKSGIENSDKEYKQVNEPDLQSKDKQDQSPGGEKQIPVVKVNGINTDSLQPTPANSFVDWDKKIIKTATIRLEIKDFKKYNNYIHEVAKRYGGYFAQEEQTQADGKIESIITIKVPVAQFDNLVNVLPAEDAKVQEKKISSDDVGSEMADTKSRLEAKKQMRLKYLDFLKQSKNMTEVLQVQAEINQIQEEIESATGRMNYLSQQTAYSTINLTFYQPLQGYQSIDGEPSFLTRITGAFIIGFNWIKELVIGLISIWPLLIIACSGFVFLKKLRRKKLNSLKIQQTTHAV